MTERVLKAVGLLLAGLTIAALVCTVIAPAFNGRGREEECRLNLRNIDRAKLFAALEHRLTNGAAVPRERLLVYLDGALPRCPVGGEYRVNPVGTPPTCSRGGRHVLPPELPLPAAEQPPAGPPALIPEDIGVRRIVAGEKAHDLHWYRVRADYNAIRTDAFWPRVGCPSGTVTAYVGFYEKIRWCEWLSEKEHAQMMARGVSFLVSDGYRVGPGPGPVNIRWWLFDEKGEDPARCFREGRYYVFCLNRQPRATWTNMAHRPSCDLDTELDNVAGVIEVSPTFDAGAGATNVLRLTRENLAAYREERYNPFAKRHEPEWGVARTESGAFRLEAKEKSNPSAAAETIGKLLYALNTIEWTRMDGPHRFAIDPPVTRSILQFKDAAGRAREGVIEYDNGGWYLTLDRTNHYATTYPHLLFEVQEDVRRACR